LRPAGVAKTHIGISKLELYRYKFNNKKMEHKVSPSFVPSVYYDFIWNNHEQYEGSLTVHFSYVTAPNFFEIEDEAECALNLFQLEKLDRTYLKRL
jgi:jouberin